MARCRPGVGEEVPDPNLRQQPKMTGISLQMNTKEKRVETILVGVDFSEASKWAVKEAMQLAHQQDAEVHFLHVIEDSMTEVLKKYSKLDEQEVVVSVSKRLEAFCNEFRGGFDRTRFDIRVGHPVKDFGNACDEIEPDLVILGAWGSQNNDRSAGTTVKQIIQECKCDVLLMHPREADKFKHVLACIDFSEYDLPIIRAADQLCLAEDASLEILHVFYPPWKYTNLDEGQSVVESADFETEYKALLQGRLDALVPANIHGVASFKSKTTVLEHSKHGDGILEHLRASKADVAVIGARGRSKIESMILGRIAERIVTESPCSVYIVKTIGATSNLS